MSLLKIIIKTFLLPFRNFKKKILTLYIASSAGQVDGKLVVNGWSKVTSNTTLGNNVNFNGLRIEGKGSVKIGDNFHSGTECLLITSFHNYFTSSKIPYDETYIHKNIEIEDNVWIGSRVLILGGVKIGEGAIIQAGSVVVSNIPKYAIAGGAPAKVFKERDVQHYTKLKEKGLFH
ncbi:DapH/DapD/GlmU-related protein [Marinilabilia sp.]|uniref:acyltransferase n=1 Tax=Marinilabilia sp. TaxID=2021252 RepID=UPI0025C216E7|nr:acyltransferase [Marinilabilia sp.]